MTGAAVGVGKALGLYIHVPFCDGKCPYCDFYSLRGSLLQVNRYVNRLCGEIRAYAPQALALDTVYFGGGTPSVLGGERLGRLLAAVREAFRVQENAEVTVEVNPTRRPGVLFEQLAAAGVTRVSIGLQSADDGELRLLGRRHTARQAAEAVQEARRAGLRNLSLDLMLGTPGQTRESLQRSLNFCAGQEAEHVSAYLLKIEPGTEFGRKRESLQLPEEDEVCGSYLFACSELERLGYRQYEISNFARPGFESRHNLKYWRCEEYLGLGPSAHSYFGGHRFYRPRSLTEFFLAGPPVQDGDGGGPEEFCMLALRLTEGLQEERFRARFGRPLPKRVYDKARLLEGAGYCRCAPGEISLTRRGFLVSNAVIAELVFALGE